MERLIDPTGGSTPPVAGEVARLASALVTDLCPPRSADPLLDAAVACVASQLDAYDRVVLLRAQAQAVSSPSRVGAESALVHRISCMRGELIVAILALHCRHGCDDQRR